MTKVRIITISILASFFLHSCGFFGSDQPKVTGELNSDFFEGEIIMEYEGDIVIYLIKENKIKRTKGLGDLLNGNKISGETYGLVVDLDLNNVTVYDDLGSIGKTGTFSLPVYKKYLKETGLALDEEAGCDLTFTYFEEYNSSKYVKDSTQTTQLNLDFNLYKEEDHEQHVFDTKNLKIQRELLEIVFPRIPKKSNFPIESRLIKYYTREKIDLKDIGNAIKNTLKNSISKLTSKRMKVKSVTRRTVGDQEFNLPNSKLTVHSDLSKYIKISPTSGYSGSTFDFD